ncbi:TonB-dependent receptor plug domain-containing protein [Sporomusa termitida]|uniref:Vitamin B12 transporter BtuB n=1 Tax=Sporomusa termitida TaxID=2377 RepID=A0A517DZC1_9FIRM|nr:TonB-dependent receptor [Sporomusa termitida]QDR82699.1 Vitamin B12 transporter BtuB [Sporomusa termitida]
MNKKSRARCAVAALLTANIFALWSGGVTLAAEDTAKTRDIVVEADAAREEAKYESQSTTIITKEDIERKQAKSVEDIIFDETGVTRTVDAMGRVGVSIRGAEPRHTLILVDGQPVMGDFAKYQGAADEVMRLGTENVERIEIIRGAASAKYGADAIGGVVNIITKKAGAEPSLQFNAEGRRSRGDGDLFPYQNIFLRADTGAVGNFRLGLYGSVRDVMPVYGTTSYGGLGNGENFRNSLRYYGDIKNIGLIGSYEIDDRNKLEFNFDRINEDLERYVKHSDSGMEPRQQFKRTMDRNTYRLAYSGNNGGSTDWQVDVNYAKLNQDDLTLTSTFGESKYEGKNTLNYIDDINHNQLDIKLSANTQVNDEHLLTYGFGYTKEKGEGSRLKNAPDTYTRYIDPWDYDKNLYTKGGTGAPSSEVHDYEMARNDAGVPYYDQDYEWYGLRDENGKNIIPAYTYEDFIKYGGSSYNTRNMPDDVKENYLKFEAQLKAENPSLGSTSLAVQRYYTGVVTYNGKTFKEEFNARTNRQTVGKAEIRKENFFLQDTWQLNNDTILAPILRVDHSDLFGTNATFNMGLTHQINGNAHRRFKANLGTGYTEPGMGELYYNWEMYAGMPAGFGVGRLGYYFLGNPDLKPEKSLNFDIGIEGEHRNTAARLNVFHNRIDNYMTTYFTGYLMDFYPSETGWKWVTPPDMIYSFRNIGKAEITGAEAEVSQKFDEHWTGKLGYTYLHALNKSDPDMPRQLLDKPQHKVDIGVTYENRKGGWRSSLWGNYYINMLDSNSIANNGNYLTYDENGEVKYNFAEGGNQTYEKKTFGLWNFLVQKDLSKDSMAYFGIDNLFNHRDDDRAFQERVYKIGLNMRFGADKDSRKAAAQQTDSAATDTTAATKEAENWFIDRPFDVNKQEGVELIGDYQARWNAYAGKDKPEVRVTAVSSVGDAAKNILEKAGHGFEQRLRVGIDARIGDNTNVTILGSAGGMSGVDTAYDLAGSQGLNEQRLEKAEITQNVKKWDFTAGRLTEPLGVTGYWFGQEYDGGRAVWTNKQTQVRIGYGDFSHSTGITDSAYTHATRQVFLRAPTKAEWLGYNGSFPETWDGVFTDKSVTVDGYQGLYQKLLQTSSPEEQQQLITQYLEVVKQDDPAAYDSITSKSYTFSDVNTFAWKKVTVTNEAGELVGEYIAPVSGSVSTSEATKIPYADLFNQEVLEQTAENIWNKIEAGLETNGTASVNVSNNNSFLLSAGKYTFESTFLGYGKYTGDQVLQPMGTESVIPMDQVSASDFITLTKEEAKAMAVTSFWDTENSWKQVDSWKRTSPNSGVAVDGVAAGPSIGRLGYLILNQLAGYQRADVWQPEDDSSLPLQLLEQLGEALPVLGTVLVQDRIPAIHNAAFVQARQQLSDHLGIQAWYLRSVNDKQHSIAVANGDANDVFSFDQLANVVGVGAKWKLSDQITFSYDTGRNLTDFGRFMNGNTLYNHTAGTSDFTLAGREAGGTPRFWVARVDIGRSDTDKPGSWNAFADYKHFEHGSFFGGNGTEGVPDRYLDGIRSFTLGAGYVPAKDFLLEAFYTFDAKGTGKRDTLYGAENFKLGDYTRVQLTRRF